MDWQQATSIGIVFLAAVLLVRHLMHHRSQGGACEDCSCAEAPTEMTDQSGSATAGKPATTADRTELTAFIKRLKLGSEKSTL